MNNNESAFPIDHFDKGLTKREYFAAMAMQGYLSGDLKQNKGVSSEHHTHANLRDLDPEFVAIWARRYADALIRILKE